METEQDPLAGAVAVDGDLSTLHGDAECLIGLVSARSSTPSPYGSDAPYVSRNSAYMRS